MVHNERFEDPIIKGPTSFQDPAELSRPQLVRYVRQLHQEILALERLLIDGTKTETV